MGPRTWCPVGTTAITGICAADVDVTVSEVHRYAKNVTAQRVLAEIVGPSLPWATARITKTTVPPVTDEQTHEFSEHEA